MVKYFGIATTILEMSYYGRGSHPGVRLTGRGTNEPHDEREYGTHWSKVSKIVAIPYSAYVLLMTMKYKKPIESIMSNHE